MSRALAGRAAVAVLVLPAGAVVGGCAVALHGYGWGLLVGIAATAALMAAIPGGWWRRLPFALGWVAAVLVLAQERPEGDQLIVLTGNGYLLLGTGVGVLMGGVVGLRDFPDPEASMTGSDASTS